MEKSIKITVVLLAVLVLVSLATSYYGSIDTHEYAGSAKYFAGNYNADIRASHSMLYGFVHAPLVWLFNSLVVFKLTSLLCLVLIIISAYYISGKSRKVLLLMAAAPLVWYMGPWINPIQLASLLFLWSFYFINKFNREEKLSFLIYSGILAGLATAFWNSILYVFLIMMVCFFYKKKVNSLCVFLFAYIIGMLPLFIFDQATSGFFLFSMAKTFISNVTVFMQGNIYGEAIRSSSAAFYISFIILIPVFGYLALNRKNFGENPRVVMFIILTILFFLLNAQIRYLLVLYPIIIIYMSKNMTVRQFRIQFYLFLVLSLIVIVPYLIQIGYSTNSPDFKSLVENAGKWTVSPAQDVILARDINQISKDYPGQSFIVGPTADNFELPALVYWGKDVKEFVSIQDYQMFLENKTVLFEKRFESHSTIQDRRQIWIEGGLSVNPDDKTDFSSIRYAISFNESLGIDGFKEIKKFDLLYLFEKI